MPLPCQSAIRRLCRISAAIKAGELPSETDCEWFAASLESYFARAEDGLTLEAAFGLESLPGGQTWWAIARRDRRDTLLRGLHSYHFPDLSTGEAARAVHAAWLRYSRTRRDIDLQRGESAAAERTLEADLFILARLGGPPGEDRVADILNGREQPEAVQVFETV